MKRHLALLGSAGVVLGAPACTDSSSGPGSARETASADEPGSSARSAKNVILFLGDGMGLSTVTAARILEGQRRGESGEENLLAFERLPHVALAKVYETDQQTPDSAGTMTALVTGSKTRAGVLSVDETVSRGDAAGVEGHRLLTLLEEAEQRGLSTGVVTTTTVTHATPAACYAHSPERRWESDALLPGKARQLGFPDIARQLLEFPHGDGLEVVLGGGRKHFLPQGSADPEFPRLRGFRLDGRDLTAEWTARSPRARYVWNRAQFEAVSANETDHLLGLFEPEHMNFEVDRGHDPAGEPSLSEMTGKALEILSRNPRGFILMVEGGRIDHGHHRNNAYRALNETIEFSNAVRTALEATNPQETLVVVTADHGHVFTMGGYSTRGNPILGTVVRNGVPRDAEQGDPEHGEPEHGEPEPVTAVDAFGLPYTTLGYHNGPGYTGATQKQPEGPKWITPAARPPGGPKGIASMEGRFQRIQKGRPDLSNLDTTDPSYLQESAVPMASETHSGEDVPVYAGGPGAQRFRGVQEQNYFYHAMVEALGWRSEAKPGE